MLFHRYPVPRIFRMFPRLSNAAAPQRCNSHDAMHTAYSVFIGLSPMQCAPVEQADEMVNEGPWSLKAVERTAEVVEPIERVTRYGPTWRGHTNAWVYACR